MYTFGRSIVDHVTRSWKEYTHHNESSSSFHIAFNEGFRELFSKGLFLSTYFARSNALDLP
jgi:hypothetical protein